MLIFILYFLSTGMPRHIIDTDSYTDTLHTLIHIFTRTATYVLLFVVGSDTHFNCVSRPEECSNSKYFAPTCRHQPDENDKQLAGKKMHSETNSNKEHHSGFSFISLQCCISKTYRYPARGRDRPQQWETTTQE